MAARTRNTDATAHFVLAQNEELHG